MTPRYEFIEVAATIRGDGTIGGLIPQSIQDGM